MRLLDIKNHQYYQSKLRIGLLLVQMIFSVRNDYNFNLQQIITLDSKQ